VTDLNTLIRQVRTVGQVLDRQLGEARAIASAGKALQVEIAQLRDDIARLERVAGVLARIGEARQEELQTHIETLVTQGLQTIFGDTLTFHLVAGTERSTPVINFEVRSHIGGQVVATDVMSARGGGLAATVGFLLNLVVLLLKRQPGETVIMAQDEIFAYVSAEYRSQLAAFLRELVDKTGVQILLVTHSEEFAAQADVRYRFDLVEGATQVSAF
jgi:DNA repair ATPase RecN